MDTESLLMNLQYLGYLGYDLLELKTAIGNVYKKNASLSSYQSKRVKKNLNPKLFNLKAYNLV